MPIRQTWLGARPPEGPFTLNTSSPQAHGLVAWWPTVSAGGGTLLRDRAGRGRDLLISGSTAPASDWLLGTALTLNGSTQYAAPSAGVGFGALVGQGAYTLSVWARTTSSTTRQAILADWDSSGLNLSITLEFGAGGLASGHIGSLERGGTTNSAYIDGGVASANQWYHLVVTKTVPTALNADVRRAIYVDGVQKATDTPGSGTTLTTGTAIAWGRGGAFNGLYLSGTTADLRFYNRALTPDEVWQLWEPSTRWQLYRPVRRLWRMADAITLSPLSGTIAVATTVSGTLSVNDVLVTLSGTSAVTTTVDGALTVVDHRVQLSGTSAVTTSVAGTLRLAVVPLTGSAAVTTSVAGTLSVTNAGVALSGTIHLQTTVAGTLTNAQVDLTGTITIRTAVNGVPQIAVPQVSGPTGITVLVRRPYLEVIIDGITQTAITDADCHFGFDQRYATANFRAKAFTGGVSPTYWLPVEIVMGASVSSAQPRFAGYILPIDNKNYVPDAVVHCRGPLGIAQAFQNGDNTWNPFTNAFGTHFGMYDLSGTVTKTAGSSTIVGTPGSGTLFTSELQVGVPVVLVGPKDANGAFTAGTTDRGVVASIADDTHFDLDHACANSSGPDPSDPRLGRLMRGRSDAEIAVFVLNYFGLSSRFVYGMGPLFDTVGGTGINLGSFPWVPSLTWPLGAEGLSYLEGLDDSCAMQDANGNWGTFRTFETVGGFGVPTIFRTLITGNPQGAPADADFAFTAGLDILREAQPRHDPQQVVNGIRVTGASLFNDPVLDAHYPFFDPTSPTNPWVPNPTTPPPYLTASSAQLPPFIPNNPTTGYPLVFKDFNFPFLERSIDDDVYSTTWNPWDGLLAENKARQLLQELNTEVVTLAFSTYRDDLFGPGQSIYIGAPTRLGIFQNMWLQALDITMTKERVFRQRLSLSAKN